MKIAAAIAAALGLATVIAAPASAKPFGEPGACENIGATATTGMYGPTAKCSAGILGHPGKTVTYTWSTPAGVGVCIEARGFKDPGGFSTQKDPRVETWVKLGCGSSGDGTVPWGNVAASPELRAQSAGIFPSAVRWSAG